MNLMRFVPIAALAFAATAWADNLTVQSTADIYAAGQATLPLTATPGSFPPSITFDAGSVPWFTVAVSNVTLGCDFSVSYGADGSCAASGTQIAGMDGLSGISVVGAEMFLAGVFLDDNQPSDDAADMMTYNLPGGSTTADAEYAPQIGQVFFIGDGLDGTGTGLSQMFDVPATATRLYLGFAGNTAGTPSFSGTFGAVDVELTPAGEPPTYFLLAGAVLALASKLLRHTRLG